MNENETRQDLAHAFETAEYQKFVEDMAQYCHCSARHKPCDGVLAGGLCDRITDDEGDLLRDDDDDEGRP